jgi:curved DNA-binding protein
MIPIEGKQKRLKVKVPKGVENGQTIRLKGQGAQSHRGGQPGDLMLEVVIRPNNEYERNGLDLTMKHSITFGQAYFGASTEIVTPWGKVNLKIPKGTNGGQKMRLKGKGMKKGRQHGDLYVLLNISIPSRNDEEAENMVKQLETLYSKK